MREEESTVENHPLQLVDFKINYFVDLNGYIR